MLTIEKQIDIKLEYSLRQNYDLEDTVFFDIETTGFSAKTTYLYLIGCIYYKDNSYYKIQWFAEDIDEEAQLIIAFFEFLKDYDVIVHYNGSGFDIPYINKKCSILNLDYTFDGITSIDIYKLISPYRRLFRLKNLKQKSIERFLGINREDTEDGGSLIPVYQSYLGKKQIENLKNTPSGSDKLLDMLILHNKDDLKGLVMITPILTYPDILEKPINIIDVVVKDSELLIKLEIPSSVPVRVSIGNDFHYFSAFGKSATLTTKISQDEMKYFYDNYKDYYYLPLEDKAIHKSLALYVDKEYREKAKASNCYTKKQGSFIPLYDEIFSPSFRGNYEDREIRFIEVNDDFLKQEDNIKSYIKHILRYLLKLK